MRQWVCGAPAEWRPLFKVSAGNSRYGGATTAAGYWRNGSATFETYAEDFGFLEYFDADANDG